MNAYFFTAGVTQSQMRSEPIGRGLTGERLAEWEQISSHIVCGETAGEAQTLFEDYLTRQRSDENPVRTKIRRLVGVQLADRLLTEAGPEEVDWTKVYERIEATFFAQEESDQAEGYWADVNQLVRPGALATDIEALRNELPDDVRSGLNWGAERQHFFLISSLTPMAPPTPPTYDEQEEEMSADEVEAIEAAMPELRDKVAGALVQARNAVVAGWLWGKFAASTPYANHEIDMEPACGIYVPNAEGEKPTEQE
jgi:hypothetical protein